LIASEDDIMNEISSVNAIYRPLFAQASPAVAAPSTSSDALPGDYLELSDLGSLLSSLNDSPASRVARIAEIRSSIERGDYETGDKLDTVVDRLYTLLTSGAPT
jgi:hypothetical protein